MRVGPTATQALAAAFGAGALALMAEPADAKPFACPSHGVLAKGVASSAATADAAALAAKRSITYLSCEPPCELHIFPRRKYEAIGEMLTGDVSWSLEYECKVLPPVEGMPGYVAPKPRVARPAAPPLDLSRLSTPVPQCQQLVVELKALDAKLGELQHEERGLPAGSAAAASNRSAQATTEAMIKVKWRQLIDCEKASTTPASPWVR